MGKNRMPYSRFIRRGRTKSRAFCENCMRLRYVKRLVRIKAKYLCGECKQKI